MKLNDRQWLKEAREYFFMVDKEINIYNMWTKVPAESTTRWEQIQSQMRKSIRNNRVEVG
jgi:hypothetical protein